MEDVPAVADVVARLKHEYIAARERVMTSDFPR
jgi:hypothetical protein